METQKKIATIINKIVKTKQPITVDNILINSLFYSCGTLDEQTIKAYLKTYIGIGFCQPKFYTQTSWKRATVLMNDLIKKDIVKPFNFGRGKGKYTTVNDNTDIWELYKIY